MNQVFLITISKISTIVAINANNVTFYLDSKELVPCGKTLSELQIKPLSTIFAVINEIML